MDEIQVHTVCAVSFIDIFRVDGLCLKGRKHLDIKQEVSTMKILVRACLHDETAEHSVP